ncbi:MAG: hypothetical protein WC071_12925 [Victivallaceae bacterium]
MYKLVLVIACAAIAAALTGCGSLNRKVGGPEMPESLVEFAKAMPEGRSKMSIDFGEKELLTNRWASKVYPIFPVFYWSTLGSFEQNEKFGVRTVTTFFPLFIVMRDSVYNQSGQRTKWDTFFNLALVLWYEDNMTPESSDFKTGILWIPGIGPLIGVGPEFFQFLWIPFTDFK